MRTWNVQKIQTQCWPIFKFCSQFEDNKNETKTFWSERFQFNWKFYRKHLLEQIAYWCFLDIISVKLKQISFQLKSISPQRLEHWNHYIPAITFIRFNASYGEKGKKDKVVISQWNIFIEQTIVNMKSLSSFYSCTFWFYFLICFEMKNSSKRLISILPQTDWTTR